MKKISVEVRNMKIILTYLASVWIAVRWMGFPRIFLFLDAEALMQRGRAREEGWVEEGVLGYLMQSRQDLNTYQLCVSLSAFLCVLGMADLVNAQTSWVHHPVIVVTITVSSSVTSVCLHFTITIECRYIKMKNQCCWENWALLVSGLLAAYCYSPSQSWFYKDILV